METTKSQHEHGGPNWEFGTCLWSPVTNANGAKFYEVMRQPRPGDLVLHNYHFSPKGKTLNSYLCGFSIVNSEVEVRTDEPPSPGVWGGRKNYYRIDLRGFKEFELPLNFQLFSVNYSQGLRDEIEHHHSKFFPFTIAGGVVRMNQGMYLTFINGLLYSLLGQALGIEAANLPDRERKIIHQTYAEGERALREVSYFQRNPDLAKAAKEQYNYTCQICDYRPPTLFGKRLQSTALDCHHLNPFSERSNFTRESTVDDVTVLCANCHRLVHSERPALKLDKAKSLFKIKPFVLGKNLLL